MIALQHHSDPLEPISVRADQHEANLHRAGAHLDVQTRTAQLLVKVAETPVQANRTASMKQTSIICACTLAHGTLSCALQALGALLAGHYAKTQTGLQPDVNEVVESSIARVLRLAAS